MQILPATEADADRWDQFVCKHPLGTPYHRWAYKRALEEGYGLATHYFIAQTADGQVRGIAPAARVPGVLSAGSFCALPYCDRGEPLGADDATTRELEAFLAQTLSPDTQLRGTRDQDQPQQVTDDPAPGQKVRLLLDLPDSSEALLAGFKSKHRSQINKAKKNGLTATVANTPEAVDAFYEVFIRNMRDLGSPTHSRRWFHAVASAYGEDCLIGLVRLGDQVIGAGIVLIAGTQAAIPWASTLRDFNRLAPNMLLYWSLLEAVTDRGCKRFDFGRSSYGEGTYKFKTQWGARPVALDWRTLSGPDKHEPDMTKTNSRVGIRPAIEAIWRRLPLPVTEAIGSRLRPRISL